jgi:dienelactone hydrolase
MLAILACLLSQDATVLTPEDQPRKMLYAYLEGECAKKFEERRKAVAALRTPGDVAKRQEGLRARFIEALGGLPERTPLNARVVGSKVGDGYRLEKVIYESRPDHHVTAVLYLPPGAGPFPAVLFPCGHWPTAKSADDYQRACILMARHGMAALCFDPIGQGERIQLLNPDHTPAVQGGATFEHTHVAVGALLLGSCSAQYLIWDGMRGLDYLESRPDIDPRRLGCMGNSGGGTQTAYLMALDPRILCAVPNCYITSLERHFAVRGPEDGEQNIPGQVAFGMEHADYLLMRAPRPTQISCTTRDFFDVRGAWTTFREAKVVYGMLGHSERADLFEYDEPHSLSRPIREAAVGWLRRWLAGVDEIPRERDDPVAKDVDLRCTASGQVLAEFGGKSVFDLTAERERALAGGRGKLAGKALLAEVRRLLALPDAVPPARVDTGRSALPLSQAVFQTEAGIKIPAVRSGGKEWRVRGPDTLYVDGGGKEKGLGREGVLALDLRGWGETLPDRRRIGWEPFFGFDWQESFLGMDLGRPLLGQRVYDLLSVLGLYERDGGVRVIGVGAAGPVVLHAAALDPRITEVTLEGSVISWSRVARTPVTKNQLTNVVPGALQVYDLSDLAASLAPRPLVIKDPLDAAGKPVTQAELEEAYRAARAAYKAAHAEGRLILQASGVESSK